MRMILLESLLFLLFLPSVIAQTVPLTLDVASFEQVNAERPKSIVQDDLPVAVTQSTASPQPIPIMGMATTTTSGTQSILLWALLGIAVFLVIFLVWRR